MTMEPAAHPPKVLAGVGPLQPCPFCGGAAMLEPDPWRGESVRIACANQGCRVVPRTEYLLACFTDELLQAWNGRPAPSARDGAPEPSGGELRDRARLA